MTTSPRTRGAKPSKPNTDTDRCVEMDLRELWTDDSTLASSGAGLLSDLSDFIRRFVTLTRAQADGSALWVVHTHAIAAADFTPYLNITSAAPRSGKTTLLQVLSLLAAKPWLTGRVTAAVLVRKTDKEHPTLLLDESDAAFQANREYAEALRGVLNTGYERDGAYSMCVPAKNDWQMRDFSTFSPKAIAGIGRLPDTVEDRSIPIRLKRKLPSEVCEGFRKRKVLPEAEALRDRAAKWTEQNMEQLRALEPEMPRELNDRQQDVCEPLIAVADLAGASWAARVRRALVELLGAQGSHEESHGMRLLTDIRLCFDDHGTDRIKTSALLYSLTANEESPWAEFQRGFPLTATSLARLLRPFDIRPRDLRFDGGILKGYARVDFEDTFARYLLPQPPISDSEEQQGQQAAVYAASGDFSEGQHNPLVAPAKSEESPVNTGVVADVAPQRRDKGNGAAGLEMPWCSHSQDSWWKRPDGGWVCGVCHPNSLPDI
jgi:hypothetical protein